MFMESQINIYAKLLRGKDWRGRDITSSTPISRWMCMRIYYRDAKLPERDDVAVENQILPPVDKYYWTLPLLLQSVGLI
jgi:hypothetical protein